jgi:uncharacterized membrane protein YidH (DUF202 family)
MSSDSGNMFTNNVMNTVALIAIIIGIGTYVGYAIWEHQNITKEENSDYMPYALIMVGFGIVTLVYICLVGTKIYTEVNGDETITKIVQDNFKKAKSLLEKRFETIQNQGGRDVLNKVGLSQVLMDSYQLPEMKIVNESTMSEILRDNVFNITGMTYGVVAAIIYISYGTWQQKRIEKKEKSSFGPYIMVLVIMGILLILMIAMLARKAMIEYTIREKQPQEALDVIKKMKDKLAEVKKALYLQYGSVGSSQYGV